MTERTLWKRFRHRLEYYIYSSLGAFIALLPRKALVLTSRFLGIVGPVMVFWEAKKARTNIDLVYGDSLSKNEKNKILRESFENVSLTMLLTFWMRNINKDNIDEKVEVPQQSWDALNQWNNSESGSITIGAHFGNWELLGFSSGFYDLPCLHVIYRRLKNPLLDEPVIQSRQRSGNRLMERNKAMIKSIRALKKGEVVGIMFDQNVDPSEGGTFAPFLGIPAATTMAAAVLHLKTGAPIFPAFCVHSGSGRYVLNCQQPIEFIPTGNYDNDVQKLTELCNERIDKVIRDKPGSWLWMYKRWRIRPTIEQGKYPDYSRPQKSLRNKAES